MSGNLHTAAEVGTAAAVEEINLILKGSGVDVNGKDWVRTYLFNFMVVQYCCYIVWCFFSMEEQLCILLLRMVM